MTLVSRVFGYARDAVIAALVGTELVADAWTAAFLLPNTLRRLVGEGNISAAFIPVFSRVSRDRSEDRVWELAARFQTAVFVVTAALTLLGILLAPWLVPLFFAGYAAVPGKMELTVTLTRWVFPYLLLISMAAVLMAVLNARDRFAAAAFTPVLLNLCMIAAGAAALMRSGIHPGAALVAGALLGGVAQWLFLVPWARRLGMPFRPAWGLSDPALRRIGRLMLPGLFGVGIIQINILVGRMLASRLQEGSITSLYFASRVNELTLGVFAISVATVVLPLMSRQGAAQDRGALRSTLAFSLRQVTAVTLPATAGMILLRHEIVAVLYQRGAFGAGSTELTAAALWGYGVGLVGIAAVRIAAPTFYALQDTRTPVLVAAVAMVANVVGCLLLRGPLENAGIALANSLAAYLNAGILLLLLRRRLRRLRGRELLASLLRVAVATAGMGWVVVLLARRWIPPATGGWAAAAALLAVILLGIVTYVVGLALLRAPELAELGSVLRRRVPVPDGGNQREV